MLYLTYDSILAVTTGTDHVQTPTFSKVSSVLNKQTIDLIFKNVTKFLKIGLEMPKLEARVSEIRLPVYYSIAKLPLLLPSGSGRIDYLRWLLVVTVALNTMFSISPFYVLKS